jgi:hypothetical protein
MAIPILNNAVRAVKNWADSGGNRSEAGAGSPFKRQKLSFDERYPRIKNPIKLNDQQRIDLMPRLGLTSVGNNELDLALSRTPDDTYFSNVAEFVKGVIIHWRAANVNDSDTAAARKLLESSSALSDIDSRLDAARLAQQQAEKEQRELERLYHEFRSIPAKHKQLTDKIAGLEGERLRLNATDFDAKIRQLIEIELNPKPSLIVAESIPSLLLQRDTLKLRLEVISDFLGQCKAALVKLADDNRRLAKVLDLPEHKL